MRNLILMTTICLLLVVSSGLCRAETKTYATWLPWQVDSVVAAWVLKRYVHTDALFESVPRGTDIPPERALDTPTSPYRRNGRQTAFDETLRIHKLDFACSEKLGPIVRMLELAPWRKSENPEAEKFEIELNRLMPQGPSKGGLEAAFAYIDQYCGSPADKGER